MSTNDPITADLAGGPAAVATPKVFPGIGGSILLMLLFIGVQLAVGIGVGVVLAVLRMMNIALDDRAVLLAIVGAGELFGCGMTLLVGKVFARCSWGEILPLRGFSPLLLFPLLVAAAGLSVVVSELDNLVQLVLPLPQWIADIFKELSEGGPLALVALVVIAPLTEESIFRGLILRGLAARYGAAWGVLLSAVLFAVMHINPYQFAAGLVTGLFLGWLCLRTRSLWPCMVLHGLYNGLLTVLPRLRELGFNVPGYTEPVPGVVQLQPLWFDAAGVGLIAAAVVGVALTTREKQGRG